MFLSGHFVHLHRARRIILSSLHTFILSFKSCKTFLKPISLIFKQNGEKMQISLATSPSTSPQVFPLHHHHHRPHIPYLHRHPRQLSLPATAVNSLGSSGYLSTIHRAMEEEEEYRKARAEVVRKGVDLEGYSIEGVSVGGHETCVILPEFKCAFDIGRCPTRAIHQNFVFITHAHLDHIGGLPMYVAFRGLYNLKPPTVFVPPCIKEDVEKLLDIHRTMSQVELNLDLVALDVGETYELRNNLVVRPFKTNHVIPSQGYVIYSVRKKLKKRYIHLKGNQIENLKKTGVEITDTILSPEVAFTGDTTSEYMLNPRSADALRAKVLITEATFLDDNISIEHAQQHGHTHLFEIIEHAQWIRNKAILLTHFSSRYSIEDIREAASKLQSKVSAKVVTLTEGFKSAYS